MRYLRICGWKCDGFRHRVISFINRQGRGLLKYFVLAGRNVDVAATDSVRPLRQVVPEELRWLSCADVP